MASTPSTEELNAQLDQARRDLKAMASIASARASRVADEAGEAAREQLGLLSSDARRLLDDAQAQGRRLADAATGRIQDNPLTSAGVAFLLGAFVASLLGRR